MNRKSITIHNHTKKILYLTKDSIFQNENDKVIKKSNAYKYIIADDNTCHRTI